MLADRSYMRSDYPRGRTSALVWIVALTIAAFLVQLVVSSSWFAGGHEVLTKVQLTIPGLQSGYVWTLFTHGLLHSTGTPFHILFTVLSLVFVGRELEPIIGSKRFVGLYVGALLLGALAWTAVHWMSGGVHIGASAGVFGLFVVLALLYPNQEINFLVMFLFPVRVRPLYVLYVLLAIDVIGLLFYELSNTRAQQFGYAASAHLGGMLAGWLYYRFIHAADGLDRASRTSFNFRSWQRRSAKNDVRVPHQAVVSKTAKSPANLKVEVDRILDKINSEGFGSLTDEEKRILDDAKDMLSRP